MLAPLLVLGAVPIVDAIDVKRLRGVRRGCLGPKLPGKGFPVGVPVIVSVLMTSATATSAGIVVPATTSAWISSTSPVSITTVPAVDLLDCSVNPLDLRLDSH